MPGGTIALASRFEPATDIFDYVIVGGESAGVCLPAA